MDKIAHSVVTEHILELLRLITLEIDPKRASEKNLSRINRAFANPSVVANIRDFVEDSSLSEIAGYELVGRTAEVRVRSGDGRVLLLRVEFEVTQLFRIVGFSVRELMPKHLAPRLPMDFTNFPRDTAPMKLMAIFCGVPGTGKSTLADAAGSLLGIPVFNADWLLGALTPFGGYHMARRQVVGAEFLTTLAFRQAILGQSVILDFPTEDNETRLRWQSLAKCAGMTFKVIVCKCPDSATHHQRLIRRRRRIPGWHDGGNWPSVEHRRSSFPPWDADVLTINTMQPHRLNLTKVLHHLANEKSQSQTG